MASSSSLKIAVTMVVALLAIMPPASAGAVDHLGIPGPIEFDGMPFELAWSSTPNAGYTKQEYLPAGQEPDNYDRMLLVERVTGDLTIMDAVRTQIGMLQERKASDPLVNMDLIENKQSGEALLDFIVSSEDAAGNLIVEWNAYRYAPARGGKKGVVLFGVSHRSYGIENTRTFLERLKTLRPAQIGALARATLPEAR